MSELPNTFVLLIEPPTGFADWLVELKTSIHTAQQRAELAVNRELYRSIGRSDTIFWSSRPNKAGAQR
jgi:hypothetical protein